MKTLEKSLKELLQLERNTILKSVKIENCNSFVIEFLATFHDQVAVPYEKNIYSKYHEDHEGKNVFANPNSTKLTENAEKLKEAASKESFGVYDDYLGEEIREIEVFIFYRAFFLKFASLSLKPSNKEKNSKH